MYLKVGLLSTWISGKNIQQCFKLYFGLEALKHLVVFMAGAKEEEG